MNEEKYRVLAGRLDEATLRLWAAVEARARAWGRQRGGKHRRFVPYHDPCGAARTCGGAAERRTGGARRVRAKGGGRKKLTVKDPTLLRDLDPLVEPTTRGDP